MATPRSQRVGIWIIAIALTVGTVGGFLAMMFEPQNQMRDQQRLEQLSQEYREKEADYNEKIAKLRTEQGDVLAPKYYSRVKSYEKNATPFKGSEITELKTKDITSGDGDDITNGSSFLAYFIGWTPDGKIFDSSIKGNTLKTPLVVESGGVIPGFYEGVDGMKRGGVREIMIPSDKAYGDKGTDTIPPNTPITFIVIALKEVPAGGDVPAPEMSDELITLLMQAQGQAQ